MKQLKRFIINTGLWLLMIPIQAQKSSVLNIDSCFQKARRNYPLIEQFRLIDIAEQYSLDNATKNYLPGIMLSGKVTYQSEVTSLPIAIPNLNIDPLSQDQFRVYSEISQSLTSLWVVKDQKELIRNKSDTERKLLETTFYSLKERISNLYFGILLMDAQIQHALLIQKDIEAGIATMETAIKGGVALRIDEQNLRAENLKFQQRIVELQSQRKRFASILSLLINEVVDENTRFVQPEIRDVSDEITRPELDLFDAQKNTFDIQQKLVNASLYPGVSVFFQGGLGRPGLNMLSNEMSSYYYTGIRLNWTISNFYTQKKQKNILKVKQQGIDLQRELFLFNTNLQSKQNSVEEQKYKDLIKRDDEIIELRLQIAETTKNQLEFGTVNSQQYINALNTLDQAQQNKILHEIQYRMARYNYQLTIGK